MAVREFQDEARPATADAPGAGAPGRRRASLPDLLRTPLATYVLFTAILIAAVAGGLVWALNAPDPRAVEIIIPTPAPRVVHVDGAVNNPGVYLLGPDARVLDAIDAAGGLSPLSSAATLNLAAPVRDGQKLVVPFALVNDGSGPQGVVGGTSAADGLEGISEPASPGLIDLNRASAEELESLPGIGPVRAAAIIDFRARNGGFVTTDDLLAVDGIGPATVASIRPLVLQP